MYANSSQLMKTPWKLFAFIAATYGFALHTANAAELSQLKLLYVGDASSQRAREFKGFLKMNVGQIEVANRIGFNPKQAEGFDVVLLEWAQGGADREFPPTKSPLGESAAWNKPTVLIGSAGLHMAILWKGKGGAG